MSTQTARTAQPTEETVAVDVSVGNLWLVAGAFFSLLLFYVVAIDEGAISVLGAIAPVHEFVHDARHFLGSPCH